MNTVEGSQTRRVAERFAVLTLIMTMVVNQSVIVIISPLVIDIAQSFDVSVALAGQLRTVSALTSAVLAPFVGVLSERIGRRPLLLFGLGVVGFSALASALAPSFSFLLAIQLFAGLGIACLLSMSLAAVGDYVQQERRTWAVGWVSMGQALAWVIGLPVIGVLAEILDWRWSFVGVPALFSFVAFWFVRRLPAIHLHVSGDEGVSGGGSMRAIFSNRSAAAWIFAELCSYAGWSGTLTFLGAFYISVYGVGTGSTGLLLSVVAMGFVVGSLLAYRVSARYFAHRTILVTAWLSALLVVLALGIESSIPVVLVLLTGFGFLQGIRGATSTALGMRQSPEHRGAMMALRASVVQLGYVVGGLLGGLLLAVSGFGAVGVAFALLIALAATLLRVLVVDPDLSDDHTD